MKIIASKFLFVLALGFSLLQSCSKSDAPAADNPAGGDAFRMQVVTINLPNTALTENDYLANLGATPIKLIKTDDHKLNFVVPYATPLGNATLTIAGLNNMSITYNVKDVVLNDTPDNIINGLKTNLNTVATTTLDTSPEGVAAQNAITIFNTYYTNASVEKKTKMAMMYQVNKAIIDDLVLNNYNNVSGRGIFADTVFYVNKHIAAVAGLALGVALLPECAVLGVAVITYNAFKAYKADADATDHIYDTMRVQFDDVSVANRNPNQTQNTILSLQDNMAKQVSFNFSERKIIAADAAKTSPVAVKYFNSFNGYNYFASAINSAINYINTSEQTTFTNVSTEQLATTNPEVLTPVDQFKFNHIQFSITNPNLQLVSSSFSASGQLNLQVKIIGTTATTPITSTLNYSYDDGYSVFQKSVPITVSTSSPCDDTTAPYPTVTIGTQVWMQKNLNVCKYRNGEDIPQVQDPSAWASLTTGAWCYYNNDTANGTVYGKLYNWYAINDPRGLAPTGYHVPSDAEWTTLTTFLGGAGVAGDKMKATTGWTPYSGITNTNSSGFTGLPGGYRSANGTFSGIGGNGNWWSSSQDDPTTAWNRYLLDYNGDVNRNFNNYKLGFSVRCVRD